MKKIILAPLLLLSILETKASLWPFTHSKQEPTNNPKNSDFEQLPEQSYLKKYCSKNCDDYHCRKLSIYLYCAQHYNKDFKKIKNKTLEEEVMCDYCSHHDNDWDHSVLDSKYWNIQYLVEAVGSDRYLNKTPQEIIDETCLLIKHLESINEPVRNRVKEWQTEKHKSPEQQNFTVIAPEIEVDSKEVESA